MENRELKLSLLLVLLVGSLVIGFFLLFKYMERETSEELSKDLSEIELTRSKFQEELNVDLSSSVFEDFSSVWNSVGSDFIESDNFYYMDESKFTLDKFDNGIQKFVHIFDSSVEVSVVLDIDESSGEILSYKLVGFEKSEIDRYVFDNFMSLLISSLSGSSLGETKVYVSSVLLSDGLKDLVYAGLTYNYVYDKELGMHMLVYNVPVKTNK